MVPVRIEEDKLNLKPKKFLLWLFVITSAMLFAALSSGYIVYTGGDPSRGIHVLMPKAFIYSTVIIVVSSITMYFAQREAKRLQFTTQRVFLVITIVLGCLFFASQLLAWKTLFNEGAPFVNQNASESFIYVFCAFHLLHLFAGMIMLVNAFVRQMKGVPQAINLFNMELSSIFWHFIGILWIYLYVFLLLNQ